MKFNHGNHWVEDMDEQETIYIDLESIEQTKAGNPYIIAKHENNTIYANIARWDEDKLQTGHTYAMTCTEKHYNENSKRNYLYYQFEEILDNQVIPGKITTQSTLADYDMEIEEIPEIDEECNQVAVEVLQKMRDEYERKLGAICYALEMLRR